jgi:hypothetical protein
MTTYLTEIAAAKLVLQREQEAKEKASEENKVVSNIPMNSTGGGKREANIWICVYHWQSDEVL